METYWCDVEIECVARIRQPFGTVTVGTASLTRHWANGAAGTRQRPSFESGDQIGPASGAAVGPAGGVELLSAGFIKPFEIFQYLDFIW